MVGSIFSRRLLSRALQRQSFTSSLHSSHQVRCSTIQVRYASRSVTGPPEAGTDVSRSSAPDTTSAPASAPAAHSHASPSASSKEDYPLATEGTEVLPQPGAGHRAHAIPKTNQQAAPKDPRHQPSSPKPPQQSTPADRTVNPSIDRPGNPNFDDTAHGGRLSAQRPYDEEQKWYQPITGSAHIGRSGGTAEENRVPVKYDAEDNIPSQWQIEASTDLIHPYDAVRGRPTPMEYISRVPPIEVDDTLAVCDGGGGHPKEFLQLNKVNLDEAETCKYCGLRYIQTKERRMHTSPHDAAERVDPTNLS